MKYLIVLIFISFLGCKKQEFEPDFSNGKATALMNDENWEGKARGNVHHNGKGIDMYYDIFNSEGTLRQRLSFNKIPIEQGTYSLFNTFSQFSDSLSGAFFKTISHDGDVIEDSYLVVEDDNISTIEILSYNTSARLLKGTFQATFFIDPNRTKANSNNPDTIRFNMGEFEVKIEE